MSKFPAKYTQLPNFEHEYIEIINRIKEGMDKKDLEEMIGIIKGSIIKNKYKHRTHLENLGLFKTNMAGEIIFSDVLKDIKSKKISYKEGLLILLKNNNDFKRIFNIINKTGYFEGNLTKKELALILHNEYFYDTADSTIERYLNQFLSLFEIIGIFVIKKSLTLETEILVSSLELNDFLKKLETIYLSNVGDYGEALAIEKICKCFIERYGIEEEDVIEKLAQVNQNIDLKYKYTFLMLPVWSTPARIVKIQDTLFTHLIIEFE